MREYRLVVIGSGGESFICSELSGKGEGVGFDAGVRLPPRARAREPKLTTGSSFSFVLCIDL